MYTAGEAARYSDLLDSDVAFGIPLSIAGKKIFLTESKGAIKI
jgi:uncharacterized ferredoxin-like protein